MNIIYRILLWLPICYIIMSLAEFYFHRYHMHRRGFLNKVMKNMFKNHHQIHHPAYKAEFDVANPIEHNDVGLRLNWFHNLLAGIPVILLILLIDHVGVIVFTLFIIWHAMVWNAIHEEMHHPTGVWWSKTKVYRYLHEYHLGHHLRPNSNYNVVCPGVDSIFGTRYNV